jgi:hypothetical protein
MRMFLLCRLSDEEWLVALFPAISSLSYLLGGMCHRDVED